MDSCLIIMMILIKDPPVDTSHKFWSTTPLYVLVSALRDFIAPSITRMSLTLCGTCSSQRQRPCKLRLSIHGESDHGHGPELE